MTEEINEVLARLREILGAEEMAVFENEVVDEINGLQKEMEGKPDFDVKKAIEEKTLALVKTRYEVVEEKIREFIKYQPLPGSFKYKLNEALGAFFKVLPYVVGAVCAVKLTDAVAEKIRDSDSVDFNAKADTDGVSVRVKAKGTDRKKDVA